MKVLVINCGSSTLKFQVVETDGGTVTRTHDAVVLAIPFTTLRHVSLAYFAVKK